MANHRADELGAAAQVIGDAARRLGLDARPSNVAAAPAAGLARAA
jgi:hypothetical protein